MTTPAPVRLDHDLAESARLAAASMSRSMAQQLSHWARIGRELERSPGISLAAIRAVLAGKAEFDALDIREQAVVRAEWKSEITARREALRLDQAFSAEGHRYATLDATGAVAEPKAKRAARKAKAPR